MLQVCASSLFILMAILFFLCSCVDLHLVTCQGNKRNIYSEVFITTDGWIDYVLHSASQHFKRILELSPHLSKGKLVHGTFPWSRMCIIFVLEVTFFNGTLTLSIHIIRFEYFVCCNKVYDITSCLHGTEPDRLVQQVQFSSLNSQIKFILFILILY